MDRGSKREGENVQDREKQGGSVSNGNPYNYFQKTVIKLIHSIWIGYNKTMHEENNSYH